MVVTRRNKANWLFVWCLLLSLCVPSLAFAQGSAFDSEPDATFITDETTGNVFAVGSEIDGLSVGTDLYWAGMSLEVSKLTVGTSGSGSVLVVGKELSLEDSTVAGSVRMVGDHLKLTNTSVRDNVMMAGAQMTLGQSSTARSFYAIGMLAELSGSCDTAVLQASRVIINGHVTGDVYVDSKNVTLGDDATIGGTLYLPQGAGLFATTGGQADTSQVGSVVYEESVSAGADDLGSSLLLQLVLAIYLGIAFSIVSLVLQRVGRRFVDDSIYVLTDRPLPCGLMGFWTVLIMPFVALLISIPLVTMPITLLILACLALVGVFSIPASAAILGALIGRKKFDGRHQKKLAVACTCLLSVVACIAPPVTLVIVLVVCTIFMAACISQVWLQHRNDRLAAEGHPGTGWLGGPFGGGVGGTGGLYDQMVDQGKARIAWERERQREKDREREQRKRRDHHDRHS